MFFATIFFMVVKIGVKLLPHIPPMEIVFFRCLISFLITYFLLKRKGHNILGNNKSLLMMRGVFGTIGLVGWGWLVDDLYIQDILINPFTNPSSSNQNLFLNT